ncbi:hypothetical protein QYE76_004033 [Lolium multiflorum]|uniref:Transposase (putative) gypsy type domain-containing protein n=1 Tax=Lolium multiflorum TaxID=4521 RepID=A0AAD8W1U6_LOLMU|nr:hypothetical protein QYE76_004033 [Lolium multiflorum]
MFSTFLHRGLSLPTHEFLRCLLFSYGIQLWQLTPNSILHLSIFITVCEDFLGIDPHWGLWRKIFYVKRHSGGEGPHVVGGVGFVVGKEVNYFNIRMRESVQGWRQKWFYLRDSPASDHHSNLPPFDDILEAVPKKSWQNTLTAEESEVADQLYEKIFDVGITLRVFPSFTQNQTELMLPAPPLPKRVREQETKEIGSVFKQKKKIVKLAGDNGIMEAFKLGGEVEIKLEKKDEMEELLKNFGEDQFKDNEVTRTRYLSSYRSYSLPHIEGWSSSALDRARCGSGMSGFSGTGKASPAPGLAREMSAGDLRQSKDISHSLRRNDIAQWQKLQKETLVCLELGNGCFEDAVAKRHELLLECERLREENPTLNGKLNQAMDDVMLAESELVNAYMERSEMHNTLLDLKDKLTRFRNSNDDLRKKINDMCAQKRLV